jgi:hypothetical protein
MQIFCFREIAHKNMGAFGRLSFHFSCSASKKPAVHADALLSAWLTQQLIIKINPAIRNQVIRKSGKSVIKNQRHQGNQ